MGGVFQTYDNFTLSQSGSVVSVSWQGLYWDFENPANNPASSNTTSFEIDFYSDDGGKPGALLASETPTNVSSQFAGQASFGLNSHGFNDTVNVLNFGATLPQPFGEQAGQTYWLSIVSHSSSLEPLFLWTSGSGGDGLSFQFNFSSETGNPASRDRAFTLDVVPVPEPATAGIFTCGLLCLAAVTRRRRNPQASR